MSESSKRAVRTAVHVAFAVLAVAAVILPLVHGVAAVAALAAAVVPASAAVSKAWNAAEDRGLIPSWLRGADDVRWVLDDSKEALKILSAGDPSQ